MGARPFHITYQRSACFGSFRPFGKIAWEVTLDIALTEEDKGFLGERYDEHAELQFLNNRYYDPELALFIQPDWLGVTEQGVGTNRYAYANNDPVNKLDPEGNSWISNIIGIALSFIPGLQPAGAALIAAGLSAVETVAAGGDLGDALKSATITFAVQMAMHHFSEGVFGGAGNETLSGYNLAQVSTQPGLTFDDFIYSTDYLAGDTVFATVYGSTEEGFAAINGAASKFFDSDLGNVAIGRIVREGRILRVAETQRGGFYGGAFADTGNYVFAVNPTLVSRYRFANLVKGYSQAPLDAVFAHETGHAAFGIIDEQVTVDTFENVYRFEKGYVLRGKYGRHILPHAY